MERVISAKPLEDFKVEVEFSDGTGVGPEDRTGAVTTARTIKRFIR